MALMNWAGLLSAAALGIAVPAQAADCWSTEAAAAARVRDLQSKLMVATMQCHAIGAEIAPAYNAFIRTNKAGLETINGAIKARFAGVFGAGAQTQYDRFTTSLANAYGADRVDAGVCDAMRGAAQEAEAIGGDPARLLAFAERMGGVPRLPGGLCPVAGVTVHVATVQAPAAPAAVVRMANVEVAAVQAPVAPTPEVRMASAEATAVTAPETGRLDGPRFETSFADSSTSDATGDADTTRSRPALTLAGLLGDAHD